MNKELSQQDALNTLISAVQVATKRGAFELAETEVILQAVKVFTKQPEKVEEKVEEVEEDK